MASETSDRSLRDILADRPADADALYRLGGELGSRDPAAGIRLMLRANRLRMPDRTAFAEAARLLPPLWRRIATAWESGDEATAADLLCLLLELPAGVLALIGNLDPVFEQILRMAVTYHHRSDFATAARLYRGILLHRPEEVEAQHLLGAAEWRLGSVVAGVERLAAAVARHPDLEAARRNLRLALEEVPVLAAHKEQAGQPEEAAAIRATLRHRSLLGLPDAFREWGEVGFKGLTLRLPAGDFTYHACRLGRYEPHVMGAFLEALRPGMTVVDVGANVGLYALLAARSVGPGGQVFAIEAVGRNAKIIRINCELNAIANVTVIPIGLSDRTGADLWIPQNEHTNNMLLELSGVAGLPFDGFEMIGVAPLDGLLGEGVRVDVLKIDIEGGEHKALRGARAVLERSRPLIFSEYAPPYLRRVSGVEGTEYLVFLQGLGYDIDILHKDAPPETVVAPTPDRVAELVDAAWAREHERGGTHLDLRLRPR